MVASAASSGEAPLEALTDAVSPMANTRGCPPTRNVGSVAVAPLDDTGKGNPSFWLAVDAESPARPQAPSHRTKSTFDTTQRSFVLSQLLML